MKHSFSIAGRPALRPIAFCARLLLAAGVVAALPVAAQTTAPVARVEARVPAGPLADALNRFALQAGASIAVDAALVRGKTSPGLQGPVGVEEGFTRLLQGSGLRLGRSDVGYVLQAGETATVPTGPASAQRPAAATQAGAAPELRPVVVTASAESAAGERVAGGFSTRGARAGVLGERDLIDTPFSIQVAPRELLESASVKDLKGLTRLDAALAPSFSGVGYYDAVSIRGLDLNNWTNYYKNGALFPNQAKTAFENIDRVEVQRGLSGFLQGFAAPGGTVNYITERPTAQWQSRAELRADGDGTFLPGVDIGGPLTSDGSLGIRLNAAGGREGFYVDNIRTDRAFGSVALDWKPSDTFKLELDAQADRRKGPTQPNLSLDSNGDLPVGVDATRFLGQPWQTYFTRTREFGLNAEWALAADWKAQLRFNNAYLYRDDFSSNIGNLQPNGDFEVYEYKSPDETRDSTNAEVTLRGVVRTGSVAHELSFGASQRRLKARFGDGVYQVVGSSNLYNPSFVADPQTAAPPSYLAIENQDRGVFVSDFITFNDRWQALVGVRRSSVDFFSVFSDRPYRDTVTTPSLALIHKPRPDTSLYASYVEGLQQGGTAPVSAANANAQLEPVTSEQVEVGVKRSWADGRLTTTAALFQIEQPLSYVQASSNVFGYFGNRRHRGLEFTASGEFRPGTRLHAGLVLLDAKALNTGDAAVDGQTPNGIAKQQFSLWLDQAMGGGWSAQLGLRGASRRTADNTGTASVPGWLVADAGLRYQTRLQGRPVDLGLHVRNLTDKFHYESTGLGQLYVGGARSVSLSASMAF